MKTLIATDRVRACRSKEEWKITESAVGETTRIVEMQVDRDN